jgi:Tol biopolymer transport system component
VTRLGALALAVTLVACGGVAPSPPPASGIGAKATFVLANPTGLLGLDDTGHALGRIIDLPAQSAPATPVLHPSKKSVVFALTQQPSKKTGFGSDLFTVNLDGSTLKSLVEHEGDNVFYASPRFDTTGNLLYFHRRAAIITGGTFVGNEDGIFRLDLRTGERKQVVKDGADPDLSPDGTWLAYVHLTQGQPDGLWRVNVDGTGAQPFFKTKDNWWYLQSPRFSPKGCEIVFSAAGHAVAAVPPASPGQGKSGYAHLSIPSFLYLAPCDGTSVKEVGQTVDDVVPAWSPDGKQIAYVGSGGFFILDVASGKARTIAQGQDFFFGDLIWLKPIGP